MQRPTRRPDQSGALAQLVERYLCKVDVRSSILLGSTRIRFRRNRCSPSRLGLRSPHPTVEVAHRIRIVLVRVPPWRQPAGRGRLLHDGLLCIRARFPRRQRHSHSPNDDGNDENDYQQPNQRLKRAKDVVIAPPLSQVIEDAPHGQRRPNTLAHTRGNVGPRLLRGCCVPEMRYRM
jgi:hypothetical protein